MDTQTERPNALSTTALVLGIASLFLPIIVLPILAIVFGAVGVSQSEPNSRDRIKAGWGVVLGVISILITIVVVVALIANHHSQHCFYMYGEEYCR